jgi:hypothetical protein
MTLIGKFMAGKVKTNFDFEFVVVGVDNPGVALSFGDRFVDGAFPSYLINDVVGDFGDYFQLSFRHGDSVDLRKASNV